MKDFIGTKLFVLILLLSIIFASISHAAVTVVKNEAELRAALVIDGAQIAIKTNKAIKIDETLIYSGASPLTIYGNNAKIKTKNEINILEVTNGADLTIKDLRIVGPGGYDINNQGEGIGVLLNVPEETTGTVKLDMHNVTIRNNAEFGFLVQDCREDPCGSGSGGDGEGSPASVHVDLHHVKIINNGNGAFDGDGGRVNERDMGDIIFNATHTVFRKNGADGLELDEGQDGDIYSEIIYTKFNNNGNYCDPAFITLPYPDEAEDIPEGDLTVATLKAMIVTPDPTCVEIEFDVYDDTGDETTTLVSDYASGIDLDDGVDFDEAGNGGIVSKVSHSEIRNNKDEGADFDEEGNGGVQADFYYVNASRNSDDGIKVSEEGPTPDSMGDVKGTLMGVTLRSNGGKAIVYEEEDEGDVDLQVFNSLTNGKNDDGDTGIEVVEDDDGTCVVLISDSTIKESTPVDLGGGCAP